MTIGRTALGIFDFGREERPAGLREELTRLFEALREPLFRQAVRILGRAAEAEDVTQEAFLRLHLELRRGEAIDNPRAWLFRAAHNLAIDRYRAERRTGGIDEGGEGFAAGGDAEQSLLEREKRQQVERLLAGLSPQERRCMELRTEGLRYREIAEVLGVRISTVETNLARAVKKLMERVNV